jgi:hypothetical protein
MLNAHESAVIYYYYKQTLNHQLQGKRRIFPTIIHENNNQIQFC